MDILCPICREPYDMDELHDVPGYSYQQAWRAFRRIGCELFGSRHGARTNEEEDALAELYQLMGDDVDGAAAMLEDFGLLG